MATPDAPSPLPWAADAVQFLNVIRNAADVVLMLDAQRVIVEVAQCAGPSPSFPRRWVGRRFVDLLGPESLSKVDGLFNRDAGSEQAEVRWRHLNLADGHGEPVPVLLKYAALRNEGPVTGILLGRDLRPTVDLQRRFQATHRELEARLEALPDPPPPRATGSVAQPGAATRRAGGVIVEAMIRQLGQQPLSDIMAETCRVLQRLCVTEALDRARGNPKDAAQFLGMTVEDLHLTLTN
jgi:hypothetical protein